jgi:hypothetical protein
MHMPVRLVAVVSEWREVYVRMYIVACLKRTYIILPEMTSSGTGLKGVYNIPISFRESVYLSKEVINQVIISITFL